MMGNLMLFVELQSITGDLQGLFPGQQPTPLDFLGPIMLCGSDLEVTQLLFPSFSEHKVVCKSLNLSLEQKSVFDPRIFNIRSLFFPQICFCRLPPPSPQRWSKKRVKFSSAQRRNEILSRCILLDCLPLLKSKIFLAQESIHSPCMLRLSLTTPKKSTSNFKKWKWFVFVLMLTLSLAEAAGGHVWSLLSSGNPPKVRGLPPERACLGEPRQTQLIR